MATEAFFLTASMVVIAVSIYRGFGFGLFLNQMDSQVVQHKSFVLYYQEIVGLNPNYATAIHGQEARE